MKLFVFSIVSDEARLNKRDAGFVDVIHTDGRARYTQKIVAYTGYHPAGGGIPVGLKIGEGSPKQFLIFVFVNTFLSSESLWIMTAENKYYLIEKEVLK